MGCIIPLAVVAFIVLIVFAPMVGAYNSMVNQRAQVDRSFADLDAQLQRRNDLIPNLVNSVRGALGHEEAVFKELSDARASYGSATSTDGKVGAANQESAAIGRLIAIVESNPQLQANSTVQDLMTQLEGTENRIAQARRDYNGTVTDYNVSIRRFPRNLIAGIFGFHERRLFEASPASREAPNVDLGHNNNPTTTVAR